MDEIYFHTLSLLIIMLPNKTPGAPRNPDAYYKAIQLFIQRYQVSGFLTVLTIRYFLFILLFIIFTFTQVGTAVESAIRQAEDKGMIKPGLIKIGDQYFIKVEKIPIQIESSCLVKSVGLLIAVYYVLSEHYPPALVNVMVFFEYLFEMSISKPRIASSKILYSSLAKNTE